MQLNKNTVGCRKHYTDSPNFRQQIDNSEVVYKYLPKKPEGYRKESIKGTHLPITIKK